MLGNHTSNNVQMCPVWPIYKSTLRSWQNATKNQMVIATNIELWK